MAFKLPEFSGNAFSFETTIWDIRFVLKAITQGDSKATDPLRGFKVKELLMLPRRGGVHDICAMLIGDFVTAMLDCPSAQKAIVENRAEEFKSIVALNEVLDAVPFMKENWKFTNILWMEVTMMSQRPMYSYFPSKK